MSDQDAFACILAALSETMLDESLWPATSALIDEACGVHGNALLFGRGPQDHDRVTCAGFYYRGQRREDLMREYLDRYHPIDERVPRLRHLPDSHLVHVTTLYTVAELQNSPAYNEGLRRLRAQHGANVRLGELDGSHIVWVTADPVSPAGWAAPQLALIRALLPHLRQFIRVRQALVRAGARGAAFATLRATSRLGVLCLDQYGQLVEANDRARALLRRGDGMMDRGGLVQASVPTEHAQLAQLIARALPATGTPVSGSMVLRRGAGAPPFVVHVTPVAGPQLDFGAQRVAALILLVEPNYQPPIDPAFVAHTLGLTPAESRIAVGLAQGRSVRDIAVTTGRKEGTVYWHMKRIYHKLAISRQADLVRLVLSVAPVA